MDIVFESDRDRELFTSSKALKKKWGGDMAKRIGRRLDDLRAASTLAVMRSLPGRCHELIGDRSGQLSLDLVHPQRLLFVSADDPIPTKGDGGLDWSRVKSVRIVGVEDTHD